MSNITPIGWDLVVGRHKLYGVGLGLALDIAPGPVVTFYALNADLETTDSGGSVDMWFGGHERGTGAPETVLSQSLDIGEPLTNARAEEIIAWCEQAGVIASHALEHVMTDWGDRDAESHLDTAIAELDAPPEVRWLIAQVVGIVREIVADIAAALDAVDSETGS